MDFIGLFNFLGDHLERFPKQFMFHRIKKVHEDLMSQIAISSEHSLRSQNATFRKGKGKHRKYLPYVFNEQGVAMLSRVLKSETAVKMSIQIISAFVTMRKFILNKAQIFQRIDNVEKGSFS